MTTMYLLAAVAVAVAVGGANDGCCWTLHHVGSCGVGSSG